MLQEQLQESSQSSIRSLSERYFELLLITTVLAGTVVIHYLTRAEYVMLHFYYLPVVVAAHYFGRRVAGTTALLAFLVVGTFAMIDPQQYMDSVRSPLVVGMMLCYWGAFLGLCAILVGTLCDQRAAHIKALREAHVGIIEVLSKYLQAADHYTKSHSMRVADLAEAIGREMHLKSSVVENIRVGALLHDIGKVEVSTSLIQKAASLTEAEQSEVATHTFHGAELVRSLGSVLKGAVPVILHHHDHWSADSREEGCHGDDIPIEARVVALADAYDAIITDRPYRRGRSPKEAIATIRECAGKQFDPEVVKAFERVMVNRTNEDDDEYAADDGEPTFVGEGRELNARYNVRIPPPAHQPNDEVMAEAPD